MWSRNGSRLSRRSRRGVPPFNAKYCVVIFELFCLKNSLIVGMQPQVSGKVGSLVGWLVGWLGGPCSAFPMTVEFYRKASCRGRNKNAE